MDILYPDRLSITNDFLSCRVWLGRILCILLTGHCNPENQVLPRTHSSLHSNVTIQTLPEGRDNGNDFSFPVPSPFLKLNDNDVKSFLKGYPIF